MWELVAAVALLLGAGGIYAARKKKKISGGPFFEPPTAITLEQKIKLKMESLSVQRGIPLPLLSALVKRESSGKVDALGTAGEIGLMQIKPIVLTDYNRGNGTSWPDEKLWEYDFNLEVGTWYLAHLKNRFETWHDALVAYNIGPTKFAKEGANTTGKSYASTILSWAGMA